MPRTIPSQRDIASRAGVSQSTVSFVLNGRAKEMGIPAATQERIRDVVEELQYVPNVAARALRNSRNGLIGVYTYERVFPLNPDDYYNEFLHGIEEGAVALGLDLVLFTSSLATSNGSSSVFRAGSNRLGIADGTVMLGSKKSDEELARLAGEGYPFVFVGKRDVPGVLVPCVTADYFSAMSSVIDLLREYSHERVLYVGGLVRGQPQLERLRGYESFAAAEAIPHTATTLMDASAIDGELLLDWLAAGWTAIVAETSDIAAAILRSASSAGVSIPDNLSLIVLDEGVAAEGGAISHIGVPRRAMGREAVSLLSQLIDEGTTPHPTIALQCSPPTATSVARPSARRIPAA
ncbi:LacI family DNA-binding transcriptional regulator [Leifsonia shinshuensis]